MKIKYDTKKGFKWINTHRSLYGALIALIVLIQPAIVKQAEFLSEAWLSIQDKIRNSQSKMREQYLRGFIVEEYLCGKMVSAEVVHDGKKACVFMISGRERSNHDELIEYRIDMPAKISQEDWKLCESYTLDIVKAIGLSHGLFHIELMITLEGPILVEVNPRIMGSYMPLLYQNLTKNNISEWLVNIHVGHGLNLNNISLRKKIEQVSSAIRFDVIQESEYIPKIFKKYVLDNFEPIYSELQDSEELHKVSPNETIGRVQVICKDHETLEKSLEKFYSIIKKEMNLELRH
ncbi:ATP-grasp domain-containing protein [Xenorhabdus sp. Reich]|uniref:ATP-grasp domain-containing protein n=1 Tax=Xenorhabdus littoralis TaxID=2582835 RepID=A0ABU4SQS8_9GAMM|nr:ATP-grasp domain-containing protein [Xenorhabdus sp. Reich]